MGLRDMRRQGAENLRVPEKIRRMTSSKPVARDGAAAHLDARPVTIRTPNRSAIISESTARLRGKARSPAQ